MKYTLPKGTLCYGSSKGYYNFYYPNFEDKYETTLSLEATDMPWLNFNGHQAMQITSPQNYLPLSIVWVKKPI